MQGNDNDIVQQRSSSQLSKRKDHRFLVDLYLEIEKNFDIESLNIEGVNLWPLIRLQLGRSFKEADQVSDAGSGFKGLTTKHPIKARPEGMSPPRNKSERSEIIRQHAKFWRNHKDDAHQIISENLRKIEISKGPRFLVQTKIEKYFIEKSGGLYSPILDPVIEDLGQFGRVEVLALEPLPFQCVNEPIRVNLQAYLSTRSWEKLEIPEVVDAELVKIEDFVRRAWPEYPFDRTRVYSRLNRLRQRRDFFFEIYKRLKPEFIVVSSFTGWLHSMWAAKDLGIPVIDVQHGGQGPIHISTTHFGKHPPNGYHFLPDVIWLWGETNFKFASKWHPAPGHFRHVPVIGGHRGVAKWNKNRESGLLSLFDEKFIARYSQQKNVLVTLSYAIDPLMPEPVFEAIQQCKELHWLIRLHPIHRSDLAKDQIESQLKNMGCQNFSIEQPTQVDMQTALFVSCAHLTPFSTSVREASAFGVPSAICHPAGRQLFLEEIETELLSYCEDRTSIIDFVKRQSIKKKVNLGIRSEAIETRASALNSVINAAKNVRNFAPPLISDLPPPDQKAIEMERKSASIPYLGILFQVSNKIKNRLRTKFRI